MSQTNLSRRHAREVAFQFLFAQAKAPNELSSTQTDFEQFCKNFKYQMDDFAWQLVEGTSTYLPSLDEKITSLSSNWRLERMPIVDLSILRLAAFEILYQPSIPKTVSINEAIELAKRFGAEESASFVNGILDKITKPS